MSALNLFNELRPLFRLLEEPVPRAFGAFHHPHHHHQPRSFGLPRFSLAQPSLELAEEDGKYVVEAELPGVRKEDVKVTVGEGGRALTISGSRSSRRLLNSTNTDPAAESKAELKGSSTNSNTTTDDTSSTPAPVTDVKAITNDQSVASPATNSGALSSFSFSRTVYLPEQVDGASIRAQLVDGILTVEIPKAAVSQPVEVQVL